VSKVDQYSAKASGWSDREYADSRTYLDRRAELVTSLGPDLQPGDEVLDLACGDAGLGVFLLARGLRYRGVDTTAEMTAAARTRLGDDAAIELADLNDYTPPAPVAATTVFRAIYYARERREFFQHVAGYTRTKLVFDLNPRQYRVDDVIADLRGAGFGRVAMRPFFMPQRFALPAPAVWVLRAAERSGPPARLALHFRFTYIVAASREAFR
jgi:methyltransferase family protein